MLKSNERKNKKETNFKIIISFCALIFTIVFIYFLPFLYKLKIDNYYHKRIKYINSFILDIIMNQI